MTFPLCETCGHAADRHDGDLLFCEVGCCRCMRLRLADELDEEPDDFGEPKELEF